MKSTVCGIEANNAGTFVSGSVERTQEGLVVIVEGFRLARMSRLADAIEEMANQVRRKLPGRRSDSWGVTVTCAGEFSFVYGNCAGGAGGGGRLKPCAERMLSSYPSSTEGLGRAFEHAIRSLRTCCA